MSFCSLSARVGSMLAPMVLVLAHTSRSLPFAVFSVVVFLAALGSHTLIETKGVFLPETLDEMLASEGNLAVLDDVTEPLHPANVELQTLDIDDESD